MRVARAQRMGMQSDDTAPVGWQWSGRATRARTSYATRWRSPETDLKWVCDRDVARARRWSASRARTVVTPDLDDVLADETVEAVAIATPPGDPRRAGFRCVEAGRHLLVEKPLANSYEAGLQMVTAGRAARRVLRLRPHVLLHAGRPEDPRPRGRRRPGDAALLRLGPREPRARAGRRSTSSGTSRRTTSRSSTSSSVRAERMLTRHRAEGADPLGLGHACVGYLTLALQRRRCWPTAT